MIWPDFIPTSQHPNILVGKTRGEGLVGGRRQLGRRVGEKIASDTGAERSCRSLFFPAVDFLGRRSAPAGARLATTSHESPRAPESSQPWDDFSLVGMISS